MCVRVCVCVVLERYSLLSSHPRVFDALFVVVFSIGFFVFVNIFIALIAKLSLESSPGAAKVVLCSLSCSSPSLSPI